MNTVFIMQMAIDMNVSYQIEQLLIFGGGGEFSLSPICFVSTKFGQLVIFLMLWFTYNKTKQGESHEFQKIYPT